MVASVPTVLFFAQARDVTGARSVDVSGETLGEVLDGLTMQYGQRFADVLRYSKVWINGEPGERADRLGPNDEIAVLPPVSGG